MRKISGLIQFVGIIALMTLISCDKDDNNDTHDACNVTDPLEELEWLKETIEQIKDDEYSYYIMANYKGETVFYNGNCNPLANFISMVRNCNGDIIGPTNDYHDELTQDEILWRHEDSKCNLFEGV